MIDSMYWVSNTHPKIKTAKKDLTLLRETPRETSLQMLYDEDTKSGLIGVPRYYGLRNFGGRCFDNTSNAAITWDVTKPIFRDSKSWWKGQLESVNALQTWFDGGNIGGLLESPCGSGKTLMALSIFAKYNRRLLILAPKVDLLQQWVDTVTEYFPGITTKILSGNFKLPTEHVVLSTLQLMHSRKDKLSSEFWCNFGGLVFDECHRLPAETFEGVIRKLPAKYRLGVSATYRRQDGMEDAWTYHIGPIVHSATIERLSGDYFQVLWQTKLKDEMFGGTFPPSEHDRFISCIAATKEYNDWLIVQLVKAFESGRKILLVSDRIKQLEYIKHGLHVKGIDSGLYIGNYGSGKKAAKVQQQEAKEKQIILATYSMLAEGTDIPTLDTLIFGTPRGDVEQVVGRIQRPVEKKRLLVVDPVFNTPWMQKLASKRERIIVSDLGFTRL